jgi:hypothetical protein
MFGYSFRLVKVDMVSALHCYRSVLLLDDLFRSFARASDDADLRSFGGGKEVESAS